MSKKILFSAIGKTDPICNNHDGSMLHICRMKSPDIIYLYLSKEMLSYHEKDNRYVDAIERLGEKLNKKFKVHIISRPKLTDVHSFDLFYHDFEMEINQIFDQYGADAEVYVNGSGGTPAMKNALQILPLMGNKKLIPLQVGNFAKRGNIKDNDIEVYDKAQVWLDNQDNQIMRCRVKASGISSLEQKAQKQVLLLQIERYDYQAALSVAEMIGNCLDPNILELLRCACARTRLEKDYYLPALKSIDKETLIPYQQEKQIDLYEYALWLDLKRKKKDDKGFIQNMSPLLINICVEILKKYGLIDIRKYCQGKNNEVIMKSKVKDAIKAEKDRKVKRILSVFVSLLKKSKVILSASLLIKTMDKAGCCRSTVVRLKEIRKFEKEVQNEIAYSLTNFNVKEAEDQIEMVMKHFKLCLHELGYSVQGEYWNSYEGMNQNLKDLIQKQD